jgi:hypothetical protein
MNDLFQHMAIVAHPGGNESVDLIVHVTGDSTIAVRTRSLRSAHFQTEALSDFQLAGRPQLLAVATPLRTSSSARAACLVQRN